jgi:hypothetical protein
MISPFSDDARSRAIADRIEEALDDLEGLSLRRWPLAERR